MCNTCKVHDSRAKGYTVSSFNQGEYLGGNLENKRYFRNFGQKQNGVCCFMLIYNFLIISSR